MHESVKEHLLASEYGWTLEYIRNLSIKDFKEQFLICSIKHRVQYEQMKVLAGINAVRSMV